MEVSCSLGWGSKPPEQRKECGALVWEQRALECLAGDMHSSLHRTGWGRSDSH